MLMTCTFAIMSSSIWRCGPHDRRDRLSQARQGVVRWCFGKTPMQTFLDALPIAKEKMIAA
jgi:hypothetical protein